MPPGDFEHRLLRGEYDYAYGLSVGDLNGDGRPDIVTADVNNSTNTSSLYWLASGGAVSLPIVENMPGWLERNAIADIDGDGRPGVVIVDNWNGTVEWFAYDGSEWVRRRVSSDFPNAYDVAIADIDNDGLPDIAAVNYVSNTLRIFQNPGADGWGDDWPSFDIDTEIFEARTVGFADFDGDGLIDILSAAAGADEIAPEGSRAAKVMWYKNPGQFRLPWRTNIIDDDPGRPIHGNPADVDGDGDADVVMASGMRYGSLGDHEPAHEIVWYENTGSANWEKHHVAELPYAFEATAGQIDWGSDVAIVASAWSLGDKVEIYRHGGDPRGVWIAETLIEGWGAANQVVIADVGGRRWLDICATADDGSRVVAGAKELRCWVR